MKTRTVLILAVILGSLLVAKAIKNTPKEDYDSSRIAQQTPETTKVTVPSVLSDSTTRMVEMTSYTATAGETDKYPMITAIGDWSRPFVSVGVSQDLRHLYVAGSVVKITAPIHPDSACHFAEVAGSVRYGVLTDVMADSTKKGKKLIRNTFDLMVQTKEQAFALGNCKDVGIIVVPGMNLKPAPRTPEDLNFLVGRHLHGIQI